MPADLMSVVAAHVERTCRVPTRVVQEPQEIRPGLVYFSPGDRHLEFRRHSISRVDVLLKASHAHESCKPAVDVMFASGAQCFGPRAVAIVLSGMGEDGLAGAGAIVAAGGSVLVQDKASSAVWGMPGAIAKADLAAAVMNPGKIAGEIVRRFPSAGRVR
jgi:two-component system chemotaxis response regulator CheB